ncbi:MAG TPA: hypothetical protein VGO26_00920 [Amnibacterium sp.]|nr:hypothetical protein [Amnibacterium sp.]
MTDELVGYPVRSRFPEGDAVAEGEDGRAVRLVRIPHGDEGAEAALEAWLRAEGDHVQGVVDLGAAPNGDLVAVVPEVPVGLVDLLAAAPLDAGEAVTVLVPITEALAALHEAGAAHGAIGPAAIGLTAAGAPVLLMPRTATLVGATNDDQREADRRALADLVRRLLPPPLPDGLLAALAEDPAGAGVDRLFTLAEPSPVILDRSAPHGERRSGMPARLVAPMGATVPVARSGVHRARLPRPPAGLGALLGGIRSTAGGVRPRVWIAASTVLAALATALVLLPAHGTAGHAAAVRSPGGRPAPAGSISPTATRAPTETTGPVASPPPRTTDPVRAAAALLDARARCLAGAGSRCLDDVDAPGSPADAADRAAIAAGVDAVRPPHVGPVLLKASGSIAVLAVGPCTVLEIRLPSGWRLRDVVAPAAARAQMPSEPSKSPSSSRARTAERNRAASAPSTIRWS